MDTNSVVWSHIFSSKLSAWPDPLPTGQHHCSTPPALHYNIHILGCIVLLPHSLSKWLLQSIPTHCNYAAKSQMPKLQIIYRPQKHTDENFCKMCCYKTDTNKINVWNKTGHIFMLHKPNFSLSVVSSAFKIWSSNT
jgi:hypothetical protein